VKTKNGKQATTYLLPIPEPQVVVEEWDAFLRSRLPEAARWYPPVVSRWGEQSLAADLQPGKNRPQALDKRLKVLFLADRLEFKSAHNSDMDMRTAVCRIHAPWRTIKRCQ
jgi:hypothetical protein